MSTPHRSVKMNRPFPLLALALAALAGDSRSQLGGNTGSIDVSHCFMHERIQKEGRTDKNSSCDRAVP